MLDAIWIDADIQKRGILYSLGPESQGYSSGIREVGIDFGPGDRTILKSQRHSWPHLVKILTGLDIKGDLPVVFIRASGRVLWRVVQQPG